MLVERVHQILGIGVQRHVARALEGLEGHDGAKQLHAVVRGAAIPLRELPFVHPALAVDEAQDAAVPARPRVAPRGAVGIQINVHMQTNFPHP